MREAIHPPHKMTQVSCTCGHNFEILSRFEKLSVDICSACHPFYTGTQKFVDAAGRVDAFTKRFAWKEGQAKEQADKLEAKSPKPTKRIQKDLKVELEKRKVFGKKKIIPVEGHDGREK